MKFSINIKIPQTWNELSHRQFARIAKALLYFRKYHAQLPEGKARSKFMAKLFGTLLKHALSRNNFIYRYLAFRNIDPEEYKEHIGFLLDSNQRTIFPRPIRRHGKKYHPPANGLNNISIRELSFVDSMYYYYTQTFQEEYLLMLIAALYREKDKRKPSTADDGRLDFSKVKAQENGDYFQFLSKRKKAAILLAYEGCRQNFKNLYKKVFPPPLEPEEGEKTLQQKQTYVPFGKLIQQKVSYDPSKLENANRVNAHEFLATFNNELIELNKHKKRGIEFD